MIEKFTSAIKTNLTFLKSVTACQAPFTEMIFSMNTLQMPAVLVSVVGTGQPVSEDGQAGQIPVEIAFWIIVKNERDALDIAIALTILALKEGWPTEGGEFSSRNLGNSESRKKGFVFWGVRFLTYYQFDDQTIDQLSEVWVGYNPDGPGHDLPEEEYIKVFPKESPDA